ncbi:MAG: hypothetical protein OEY45_07525 [Gammaproteobacteria bacterium]|nr:hypothetical protein [Gammaproteobacteria bacterium]
MIKLFRALLALVFLFYFGAASSTPLTGSLHVYDPFGFDFCEPPGTGACGDPLTGDYDATAGTLSFDPILFLGTDIITNTVELLPVGTHTRSDGFGGTITASVNPGQIGAYIILEWDINILPTFMVWDVAGPVSSQTFIPVDSDGDGIPGHAVAGGPFPGFTGIFEFVVEEPGPDVDITLAVTGGTTHECASTNGTVVEISANLSLTGGAILESISWTVDGLPAGSGTTINTALEPGSHDISATALTTTGETDTETVTVNIVDTTAPVLDVAFIDDRSGMPVSHIDRPNVQWIKVQVSAADACDDSPQTHAVGGFSVQDGDLLKIQGNNDTVTMTTSKIDLSGTATDASGNSSSGIATLHITD